MERLQAEFLELKAKSNQSAFKAPAARLKIPKNLDKIPIVIQTWEESMDLMDCNEKIKTNILKSAIIEADLELIYQNIDTTDSYDDVKSELFRIVKQSDYKLIKSPKKAQPLKCFKAIEKCFAESTLFDKIAALKEHLDRRTIKNLQLNCETDKDVKNKLKIIEENGLNNKKKEQSESSSNSLSSSSSSSSSSESEEEESAKSKKKSSKKRRSSKEVKLEKEIKELREQMNKLKTESKSVNAVSNNQCKYHAHKGTASFRCSGPDCTMFNASIYHTQDLYSYINKQGQEDYKRNRQNRRRNRGDNYSHIQQSKTTPSQGPPHPFYPHPVQYGCQPPQAIPQLPLSHSNENITPETVEKILKLYKGFQ